MTANPASVRGASRAAVVWWFRGRRSERDDQARGLLKALETECPLEVYAAPLIGTGKALRNIVAGRYPAAALPDPDLLLGTGRETHWSLLAARRARGGRIVTLSRPRLPRWWFDLCIVAEHDGGRNSKRMIATRGALPPPSPPRPRQPGTGLVVVGGPTDGQAWSDDELLAQIDAIFARHSDQRWFIATTPQTLAATEQRLHARAAANVFVVPHHEADPHWLSARLQDAEQVWISEDRIELIYQGLSAGAATGVLAVPRRRPGVELAALTGMVVRFADWQAGESLHAPQPPFNEAARCAAEIHRRWLAPGAAARAAAPSPPGAPRGARG